MRAFITRLSLAAQPVPSLTTKHDTWVSGAAASIALDRADFDRARPGGRVLGRDLDRLVQIGALDHVVASDLLLGLGEWPIADQHLAVADLHRGGVADVAEGVTVPVD